MSVICDLNLFVSFILGQHRRTSVARDCQEFGDHPGEGGDPSILDANYPPPPQLTVSRRPLGGGGGGGGIGGGV